MITYSKERCCFESMYKKFPLDEVPAKLIYEWIKTGKLSLKDFKVWINHNNEVVVND